MNPSPSGKGALYLIPSPIGQEGPEEIYPASLQQVIGGIRHFIVEKERTARRLLSKAKHPLPIEHIHFTELDKHATGPPSADCLRPAMQGQDMGLLSEAGCPGVADPGQAIVGLAHQLGIRVIPLAGPSSILLALMASGFNGQRFTFHGYLPIERSARTNMIREMERQARRNDQTQVFMETPYRNDPLLKDVLSACQPDSRLCIACDLGSPTEFIRSMRISAWKDHNPKLHKRPCVFLLYRP